MSKTFLKSWKNVQEETDEDEYFKTLLGRRHCLVMVKEECGFNVHHGFQITRHVTIAMPLKSLLILVPIKKLYEIVPISYVWPKNKKLNIWHNCC